MQYRRLGQSDLEVSALSLGILSMVGGGSWGAQDEGEALRTIDRAYDGGINFFDTAENYADGESERLLGRATKTRRSEVIIASKVSAEHLAYDDLIRACEGSLRRLNTDYIDLYYIHWPNPSIPLSETMAALEHLQQQGKIRVAGCSNFGHKDLGKLLLRGRVEANQLPYSLLWRAIEYEVMASCAAHQVSITCYSPLEQGLLTGKCTSPQHVPDHRARNRLYSCQRAGVEHGGRGVEEEMFRALAGLQRLCDHWGITMTQAALRWTLAQEAVGSVIVGCRIPDQLEQSLAALEVELPPEAWAEVTALTDGIKETLGPNPDKYSPEDQSRYDRYPE